MNYHFGAFELQPEERRLLCHGDPVPLTPKAFDLLVIFASHPGHLLMKQDLIDRLWPGVYVEEVNLAQNVSAIRRALKPGGGQEYIQTVAGAGYRFAAPAAERAADTAARGRTQLIVLPFRMLKPDADFDFLAFSLADALTASLSTLDTIAVRSSLVAARFGSEVTDLARVARDAQVDVVVSGTVLRVGDQIRVTTQMAEAATATVIASHAAQASTSNLLQLPDALVDRIVASLALPLTGGDRQRLRHDVPATARAYECYLRGNARSQEPQNWNVARELYLQTLAEDATFAPAWARLARVDRLIAKYRPNEADALQRAEASLQQALALDPDLAIAHHIYAQLEVDRGRADDALTRLLTRARAHPDAAIFAALVHVCRYCGLMEASLAAHARAQERDPTIDSGIMHTYWLLHRYDDVVRLPGAKAYVFPASLIELGRGAEARAIIDDLEARSGNRAPHFARALKAFIDRRHADGVAELVAQTRAGGVVDPENLFYAGRHLAHVGEDDVALPYLVRAVEGGYTCYPVMAADSWLDALRPRADFQSVLMTAKAGWQRAARAFAAAGGPDVLG